jgi:hypothetical protein
MEIPFDGELRPTTALRRLPSRGALFWIYEYSDPTDPGSFPPRPTHFSLGPARMMECSRIPTHVILFEDHGRFFEVEAALGEDASPRVQGAIERALDSLKVRPND